MTDTTPATTNPADWDEALHLLADETRINVLIALVNAGDNTEHGALTYSELKAAVDISDNGTFNYHLNKLLGHFVEKTNNEYTLRYPGLLAYRALTAGVFTADHDTTSFELQTNCHECGTALTARYTDDHAFYVDCPPCDTTITAVQFPPPGFDSWSDDHLLRAVDYRMRHDVSSFVKGICPWCAAAISVHITRPSSEGDSDDYQSRAVYVTYICDVCHTGYHATVGESLLSHPAVVAFCYDHGLDLTETRSWELKFAATDHCTEVLSEDPWRIALTISLGGDQLRVVVDGNMDVCQVVERDSAEQSKQPASTRTSPQ